MIPTPALTAPEVLIQRLSYSVRSTWTHREAAAYLAEHPALVRAQAVQSLTAAGVLVCLPGDPARLELDAGRRLIAAEAGRCLALLRARARSGDPVPLEEAWRLWRHTTGAATVPYQEAALYTLQRAGYVALEPGVVLLLTAGVTAEVRVCNLRLWTAQRPPGA